MPERAGKLVQGRQKAVAAGPFAEAKDVIGGYLLVEAEDLAHAVELAKGCPVLEHGGTVEVRPVMKMSR
ncbi:YciI family protein [Sorangium sp. So ce291]|uniref:YciI family protein n=1 Tax=Sorangium sp. So ce291 TaxID=3133294 RepID=UPI003F629EA6